MSKVLGKRGQHLRMFDLDYWKSGAPERYGWVLHSEKEQEKIKEEEAKMEEISAEENKEELEALRLEYERVNGKKVSNKYKNNLAWIREQLSEKA